jgi:hypothetical protein
MNPPYFTFTPLHRHFDEGFGAIGDAFKAAGDELSKSKTTDMHAHLPVAHVYRHAIELYLKSLILIVHKKCDAEGQRPQVMTKRGMRPFDTVHTVGGLWDCFKSLTQHHAPLLRATSVSFWDDLDECESWIRRVDKNDPLGTLLKYASSGKESADRQKESFKVMSDDLVEKTRASGGFVKALVLESADGSTEAYMLDYNPINELSEAASKCADFLSTAHFAMRCELTNGL